MRGDCAWAMVNRAAEIIPSPPTEQDATVRAAWEELIMAVVDTLVVSFDRDELVQATRRAGSAEDRSDRGTLPGLMLTIALFVQKGSTARRLRGLWMVPEPRERPSLVGSKAEIIAVAGRHRPTSLFARPVRSSTVEMGSSEFALLHSKVGPTRIDESCRTQEPVIDPAATQVSGG